MTMTTRRTITELEGLSTLEERFDYLQIGGVLGEQTFGRERWINQQFYRSREWRDVRQQVIARDMGMDMGVSDTPIRGNPVIHHMNPIRLEDFDTDPESLINPEYLITVSLRTHNAIHYGDKSQLPRPFVARTPGDTRLSRYS